MQNIRLDYIVSIDPEYRERMGQMRRMYIDLDLAVQEIEDNETTDRDCAITRTIELARTHLEISMHYAIKSLSLAGEKTN